MKILDKNYEVKIDDEDLKDAKLSSIEFTDVKTRKRAFANILGARLAMKFLFSQDIQANNLYSLYTIHGLLGELDIADIYFNNIRIDIRLVFDKKEIFIPKSHSQYNIVPDLYLVLGLADDMSAVEVLGFSEPSAINKKNSNQNFYFYDSASLRRPDELADFLENFVTDAPVDISEDAMEKAKGHFLALADKEIPPSDKLSLFKQLAKSHTLREKIVEFENFEFISKEVAKSDDLLGDATFDIVGAQQVADDTELTKSELKKEISQAIGKEEPKKSKMGLDSLLAESQNDVMLPEPEKDKHGVNTGAIVAGGLTALAAGLELGSAVMANETGKTAAVATLGTEAINQGAKALSAGIDGVMDAIGSAKISDLTASEDSLLGLENFEDLGVLENVDMDEEAVDFTPSYDMDDDSADELIDFDSLDELTSEKETFGEEAQDVVSLDDFDFSALDEMSQKSNETAGELVSFDEVEDMAENNEEIQPFAELEKLEVIEDLAPLEEIQEPAEEETLQETALLEEFGELEPLEEIQEEELLEEIGEAEVLSQVEDVQEIEEAPSIISSIEPEMVQIQDESEDLVSQVDDFLDNAELSELSELSESSDEQNTELEEELVIVEEPSAILSKVAELTEDVSELESEEEEIVQKDKDSLTVLFEDKNENGWKNSVDNFDVDSEFALPERNKWVAFTKNKRMVIAASVAGVVLTSFIVGGVTLNNNNMASLPNNVVPPPIAAENEPLSGVPAEATADLADMSQQNPDMALDQLATSSKIPDEPQQATATAPRDMGRAVSDAFLSEPVNATISKIAWEVPEDLAYNDAFRQYLQTAGKNLKLNLQNNLLLATEMAYSNKVIMDLEISKDGSLTASSVVVSSGSKQIDQIVLQSLKETLKYLKMPSGEVRSPSIVATLIINF